MSNQEKAAKATGNEAGFIDEPEFLSRVPICRRTAANLRKSGKLPYVKLGKRVLYHWKTVQDTLLRHQKGG